MPKFSELQLKFTGDVTDLRNALRVVNAEITEAGNQINKQTIGFQRLGSTLTDIGTRMTVGVSLPLVAFGGAALQAAGKMEQAEVAFRTLYKSADVAKTKLEEIKKFAASTPFQFPELVAAARQMAALGFSADELIPVLTKIGNASSSLALGADGFERIIRAIGQMKQKGTVQAEEFRQLAEAGIPAWEALAKTLGVGIPEAMSMVEKRSVSAATGIKAVMDILDQRFAGGMAAQAKTFQGMWSNVLDAINFTLADIGKALLPLGKMVIQDFIYPTLNGMKSLAASFAELPSSIQIFSMAIGGVVAAAGPVIFILGQLSLSITSIASAIGMMKAIPAVAGLLSAIVSPATAAVAGIAALGVGAIALGSYLDNLKPSSEKAAASINQFRSYLIDLKIPMDQVNEAVDNFAKSLGALPSNMTQSEAAMQRFAQSCRKDVVPALDQIKNKFDALGAVTNGPIASKEARSGLTGVFDLIREKAGAATEETKKFDDVAKRLGVKTMKQLNDELKIAKAELSALEQAYKGGANVANLLAAAKQRVRDISDSLHPSLKKQAEEWKNLGTQMIGAMTKDEATADWMGQISTRLADLNKSYESSQLDSIANSIAGISRWSPGAGSALQALANRMQQAGIQADVIASEIDKVAKAMRSIPEMVPSQINVVGPDLNLAGVFEQWDKNRSMEKAKDSLKQMSIQYGQLAKDAKDSFKVQSKAAQEISTVFNDMYRKMADLIFQGGKFKDMMLGAAEQIGRGFLRLILKAALEPIEKMLSKIADAMINFIKRIMKDMFTDAFKNLGKMILDAIGGLKSLGTWMAKIFGGGGSSAAGGLAGVGGIGYGGVDWGQFPGAPGASKGTGSAASAAGSSVAGIVGAVGSVASAVSGIIGNFQSMAQNKSLDILVKHTLQMVMQGEVMRPFLDNHLSAIHGRLMEIRQIGVRVFTADAALAVSWQGAGPAGAAGGITNNFYGNFIGFRDMDAFFEEITRRVKAALG